MTTVSLSSKFQIVIPKIVRESLDLDAGLELEVIPYEHRIELIPLRPMKSLKGVLKGISTSIKREKDRL